MYNYLESDPLTQRIVNKRGLKSRLDPKNLFRYDLLSHHNRKFIILKFIILFKVCLRVQKVKWNRFYIRQRQLFRNTIARKRRNQELKFANQLNKIFKRYYILCTCNPFCNGQSKTTNFIIVVLRFNPSY